MSEVRNKVDFIQLLGPDMSIKILTHLDDPCDLIRVSSVSSSWHRFVIEHGLCKQLCLKMFPEISGVAHIIELDNIIEPLSNTLGSYVSWESHKRNHRVYAFLASGLTPMRKNCISKAISASSTDNYPEESILHTLEPGDRTEYRASYWSSKGESDPSVPETLVYELASKLCLVTEIYVHPFQAYFQHGFPIYSAKAVRFRMGHSKHPMELESPVDNMAANHVLGNNQFIWTYTSPEFPMLQIAKRNCLHPLGPESCDLRHTSEKKNSVQKGSRATMCSTIHKPSSHRGYTQQSSELGSCHIRNLAEGKRVDVFSVAYHLVSCLGASKSWFPNFTIVDKVSDILTLQENRLQKFKLPEPVLCIGGVLLVELLGRVQKQEMDELFYICISHVQVMGRLLFPEFDVKIHHWSGKCTLKYCPQTDCYMSSPTSSPRSNSSNPSRLRTITSSIMQRGVRRWEQFLLGALLGTGPVVVDNEDQ
ncbi:F-box protein [Glycine max]|nr:F-box protein [Glycine max]KAH1207002.1 F-box protein [Glycine max]KAH1207003.1 F-box protein [Glycine max]